MPAWLGIKNLTRGCWLANRALAARGSEALRVGLLNSADLRVGEGLVLSPCRAVHTQGMAFPIDVIFLDGRGRVLQLATLSPGFYLDAGASALAAVELPEGTLRATGTKIGDVVGVRML